MGKNNFSLKKASILILLFLLSFTSTYATGLDKFGKKFLKLIQKQNYEEFRKEIKFVNKENLYKEVTSTSFMAKSDRDLWENRVDLYYDSMKRDAFASFDKILIQASKDSIRLKDFKVINIESKTYSGYAFKLGEISLYLENNEQTYKITLNKCVFQNGEWVISNGFRLISINQDLFYKDYGSKEVHQELLKFSRRVLKSFNSNKYIRYCLTKEEVESLMKTKGDDKRFILSDEKYSKIKNNQFESINYLILCAEKDTVNLSKIKSNRVEYKIEDNGYITDLYILFEDESGLTNRIKLFDCLYFKGKWYIGFKGGKWKGRYPTRSLSF